MCFGGSKGTGGNQGGNANKEDGEIRKQFTKEGKTAREARTYFRDRDAGKFLNSTNYRQDELGNVKIDTAPKYFKDQTIADVLEPEMYNANKVNTTITFGEREAAGYNKYSKMDMLQARSRFNKYGPDSKAAIAGDIKTTPFDMVDYDKFGTVQGLGSNKYMDERGRGQLVFDPGAAIYGQPALTDKGDLDPKYDKTRESLVGRGLTNFTQGIQDNPLRLLPFVGTALSFIDKFKKGRSEEVAEVSNKRGTRTSVDDYDNMGGLRPDYYDRYLGDTQYDMFGDSAYPSMKSTGDIIGRADQFGEDYVGPKGSLYEPGYIKAGKGIWDGLPYSSRSRNRQDERMLTLSELANTKRGVAMASPNYTKGDEVIIPKTQGAIPRITQLASARGFTPYDDSGSNVNDDPPVDNTTTENTTNTDPYADYAEADTAPITGIGQSSYGGKYSYGAAAGSVPNSPFWARYGFTTGTGYNPSVQARYINPTTKTYFMAPAGLNTPPAWQIA